MSFHAPIFETPLPNVLIISGIFFLLIAIIGEFRGRFDVGKTGRIVAGVVGPILIITGLLLLPGAPVEENQNEAPGGSAIQTSGGSATQTSGGSATQTSTEIPEVENTPEVKILTQPRDLPVKDIQFLVDVKPQDEAFAISPTSPFSRTYITMTLYRQCPARIFITAEITVNDTTQFVVFEWIRDGVPQDRQNITFEQSKIKSVEISEIYGENMVNQSHFYSVRVLQPDLILSDELTINVRCVRS